MRTRAIVIKKVTVNEFDQLIYCLSEEFGHFKGIAKGILRPTSVQSMHLDNFNVVEFEVINGRATPIIAAAQVVKTFPSIKSSLKRLAVAQFFAEVLDKVSFENERDPKLWSFFSHLIEDLSSVPESRAYSFFRTEQAAFLEVLGYAPQINKCVICSNDLESSHDHIALSPELGGALCETCFLETGRGILFSRADVVALRSKSVSSVSMKESRSPLDTFFEYTLGRKLHSLDFLYSVV